ncbi:hypothetical protein [Chryseobacterium sp. 2R14A]|uniref:hypothetical protein n=1 Tax=Chryseobacterium sp. 2R14A TaxID=3380353 RepID=UPI003CF10270
MESKKITLKQYLQFVLVMTAILGSLFLFVRHLRLKRIEEVKEINKDYSFTKGVITKMSYHKGRHVSVTFKANGSTIEGSDGIQKSTNKESGDSIGIKYWNKNPEIFITELHLEY